jgi:hypothetical protein
MKEVAENNEFEIVKLTYLHNIYSCHSVCNIISLSLYVYIYMRYIQVTG